MSQRPLQCCTFVYERVAYTQAWQWQKRMMQQRLKGEDSRDVLLLLEHEPVYTMGRSAKANPQHLEAAKRNGVDVQRIERGGKITYHGPGQIVGYPLLDLRRHRKDLHWYVRQLEQVLLQVLKRYGIEGRRHDQHTGAWVGNYKVGAIGINCSRWMTMHGFALNVLEESTAAFSRIVPCGIDDRSLGVASVEALVGSSSGVSMDEARKWIVEEFQDVFQVECLMQSPACSPVLSDSHEAAESPTSAKLPPVSR